MENEKHIARSKRLFHLLKFIERRLTNKGFSKKDIAFAVYYSDRQVRRWFNAKSICDYNMKIDALLKLTDISDIEFIARDKHTKKTITII